MRLLFIVLLIFLYRCSGSSANSDNDVQLTQFQIDSISIENLLSKKTEFVLNKDIPSLEKLFLDQYVPLYGGSKSFSGPEGHNETSYQYYSWVKNLRARDNLVYINRTIFIQNINVYKDINLKNNLSDQLNVFKTKALRGGNIFHLKLFSKGLSPYMVIPNTSTKRMSVSSIGNTAQELLEHFSSDIVFENEIFHIKAQYLAFLSSNVSYLNNLNEQKNGHMFLTMQGTKEYGWRITSVILNENE